MRRFSFRGEAQERLSFRAKHTSIVALQFFTLERDGSSLSRSSQKRPSKFAHAYTSINPES